LPHIVFTPRAIVDLRRCRSFLEKKDAQAAVRASAVIDEKIARLRHFPSSGRRFARDGRLREVVIDFGDAGYVALYRYEPDRDLVFILAFRHQRELGY
jgi:plasmid stabilization system protein ParE